MALIVDNAALISVNGDDWKPFNSEIIAKLPQQPGIFVVRVEDCVINRADFIYLAAGQVPNFRTINIFRLRHLHCLGALFAQIVLLCRRLGMIGFEHLAVDGQKIQANANFRKSRNLKGLKSEYEKVKAGLEKLLDREVSEHVSQETKDRRAARLSKKRMRTLRRSAAPCTLS